MTATAAGFSSSAFAPSAAFFIAPSSTVGIGPRAHDSDGTAIRGGGGLDAQPLERRHTEDWALQRPRKEHGAAAGWRILLLDRQSPSAARRRNYSQLHKGRRRRNARALGAHAPPPPWAFVRSAQQSF